MTKKYIIVLGLRLNVPNIKNVHLFLDLVYCVRYELKEERGSIDKQKKVTMTKTLIPF